MLKIGVKKILNKTSKNVGHHEDSQVVMQIIRVAFTSFLPHVSLLSESDVLVNTFLSSILKSLQNLIGNKETVDAAEAEEYLECVLLCMECCKILLSFFLHFGETEGKLNFGYVEKVPHSASLIVNLSMKHYKERNKFYTSIFPEIEALLQSLFKETIEGCTILCEFVSKISWAEYSQEETCSLSEVCENLSEIAHCFSCLSEVKISVIAWKTYASLIQNYNEEIKRDIVLVPTEENEEKIFDRVLKRTVFNLRILIIICDKFGGYLRGTYSKFLSLLLLLLRYSSESFMLKTLPDNCKKKIDEQLMVGLFPLLSHLQKEKEFIQEVFEKFDQKKKEENHFEDSLLEQELESSEDVSFLLVTFDEQEFSVAEKLLFKNALCHCPWKSIFATDVLCFISRYGSASLCESHCTLLITILSETPSMKRDVKKRLIRLLARLLGFAKVSSLRNILTDWINGELKPPRVIVAELLYFLRVPISEELLKIINKCIFSEDQFLTSTPDTLTEDNMKTVFEYLESVWLYLMSPVVKSENFMDKSPLKNLSSFLSQLFERFPLDYLHCSFVARLFCTSLNLVPCLIQFFDEEGVYKIYEKCKKAICNSTPNVILFIANFVSNQSVVENDVKKTTLKIIEELFVSLLTQPGNFIRIHSIKALITFAQFTKHEEVFSSVVSRLPHTVSEEVTDYLQCVPQKSNHNRKLFHQQMIHICYRSKTNTERKDDHMLVSIPNEILKRSKSDKLSDFHIEKSTKRRKLENIDGDNDKEIFNLSENATEILANLKTIENNLRNNPSLRLELKEFNKETV
ncbi:hypothetical protein Avbf_10748 [Armadillidium vulgare]|nr:hypothetical protein Avbf_10748 [Armadillidium vulgare]